jgi:hypothetical protein
LHAVLDQHSPVPFSEAGRLSGVSSRSTRFSAPPW